MLVYFTVFNDFFFKLEQLVTLKYAKNLKLQLWTSLKIRIVFRNHFLQQAAKPLGHK